MSIASVRTEKFTATINGLAASGVDTSVVIPFATASVPVVAGSIASVKVSYWGVFSNGNSYCAGDWIIASGTGPAFGSPGHFGGAEYGAGALQFSGDSFNGSGDLVLSLTNFDASHSVDVYLEIETTYVKT